MYVHVVADFTGGLRVACGAFQISQPFLHQSQYAIANRPRPIVELQRRGGEETASGESFSLAVGEPVLAKRAKKAQAAELRSRKHDFFDEDVARFVHNGTLQFFLGAKVSEKAALADAQGSGQLANGQTLKPFQGSDIDGFAQDGAPCLQAARALRRRFPCWGGGPPRARRCYGALCRLFHGDGQIIA